MTVLYSDNLPTPLCGQSHPGHVPHFIQAKRALGSVAVPLTVLAVTDRGIVVSDGEGSTEWLVHKIGRDIVRAKVAAGETTLRDHGTSFAIVGDTAISYCDDPAEWTECGMAEPSFSSLPGMAGHFTVTRPAQRQH